MTIVCLEGASAVGKTTTARTLREQMDAIQVPEVNALFDYPADESETWYLERQVDRWRLARERESANELVVLDGDLLGPLWDNWIALSVADRGGPPARTIDRDPDNVLSGAVSSR